MKIKKTFAFFLGCIAVLVFVVSCSDDKQQPEKKAAFDPFDHSHDVEVTDVEKHKFEHKFADQCVQRELRNAPNSDKEHFTKPCLCIGTYLMKDLTAQEAEKFMVEHENAQSLKIKYDAAAYHCLQENAPPKDAGFISQ